MDSWVAIVTIAGFGLTILTTIRQSIRGLESRLGARFDALEARFDALEARFSALEARLTAVETRLTALETRLTALVARVTALETRVSALETRVDALAVELYQLKGRFDAAFGLGTARLEIIGRAVRPVAARVTTD